MSRKFFKYVNYLTTFQPELLNWSAKIQTKYQNPFTDKALNFDQLKQLLKKT
jgi:hypothetical protein